MTPEQLEESRQKRYIKTKDIDGIEHKHCGGGCDKWLPIENFVTFGKQNNIVSGKQKRSYQCNSCRNIKRRGRTANDPNYQILNNLRTRLWYALKGRNKSESTLNLIGCSVDELWKHLESQFVDGMTLENYGPIWQVDHQKPCAIFDLTDPRQQRQCFNWRNLQPMFGPENSSKGDVYDFDIILEITLGQIK